MEEVVEARHLTTANSISLGRLLPQIGYYVWGVAQWEAAYRNRNMEGRPTFVVPSGNFGNLTAAVYAKAMGTPIGHLVAATNANDAGAQYLRTGSFVPRAAVQTHSNAMDVGTPATWRECSHTFAAKRVQCDGGSRRSAFPTRKRFTRFV